jgi:sugar phosphate isomerase/epimerase
VIPTVIPYDENNDMFKELMTIKTIDQLHEDTHNKKKEEGRLFKEEMLRIAKQDGIIGMELNGDEYFANIIDAVIKKQDDEDHLFALKIAVFENIKQINESDDVEGKKKIRQAKNKIELFRAVFDMIE